MTGGLRDAGYPFSCFFVKKNTNNWRNFMAEAEGFAILSLLLTSKILHNYNEKNNNSNPYHSITDFPSIS